MKKEKYSIEGSFGIVLRRLAIKLRSQKEDNLNADLINAAARLLGKYNDHLKIINKIDDETETGNDYYSLLESPDGPPIDGPAKRR